MTDHLPPLDEPQPLIKHLIELRDRMLRAMLAIAVVFFPLLYFSQELYTLVAQPLMQSLPAGTSMIATDVTSPFLVPFKLTLYVSLLLAMPLVLHQLWGFVSPGLYKHEKRFAVPLLASSILLFYAGVAFAYFVVFPVLFGFFTAIAPEGVAVMTDISRYLDFVITLFIAFGAAFELPVAILLMVWSGITTVESLKEKRPYVVVGCFVVGMLLTPPDVISQTLLAVPMWMLFEAGVFVAGFIQAREKREA